MINTVQEAISQYRNNFERLQQLDTVRGMSIKVKKERREFLLEQLREVQVYFSQYLSLKEVCNPPAIACLLFPLPGEWMSKEYMSGAAAGITMLLLDGSLVFSKGDKEGKNILYIEGKAVVTVPYIHCNLCALVGLHSCHKNHCSVDGVGIMYKLVGEEAEDEKES